MRSISYSKKVLISSWRRRTNDPCKLLIIVISLTILSAKYLTNESTRNDPRTHRGTIPQGLNEPLRQCWLYKAMQRKGPKCLVNCDDVANSAGIIEIGR